MSGSRGSWAQILDVKLKDLDERTLKRAYAKKIKTIDPVADPKAFQDVRSAYEGLKKRTRRPIQSNIPLTGARDSEGSRQSTETTKKVAEQSNKTPSPVSPKSDIGNPLKPATSEKPANSQPRPTPDVDHLARERHKAQALAKKAQTLLHTPWATNQWRKVFSDPLMDNMATASIIEFALVNEMLVYSRNPENKNKFPPGLTKEALQLIEDRFGWYSDVPRLNKKFGFLGQQLISILISDAQDKTEHRKKRTRFFDPRLLQKNLSWSVRLELLFLSPPWYFSSFCIVTWIYAILHYTLRYLTP